MKTIIFAFIVCLILITKVSAQKDELSPALASLVETERAFAKFCAEKGQPESWLEFFADDGIMFRPAPVNAKEFMRQRLPTPTPKPFTLYWEPSYGNVSSAGDLGYNLGPWKITDLTPQNRPSQYGYFFSVWKKQTDGSWKVVADLGIQVKEPTEDHKFGVKFVAAQNEKVSNKNSLNSKDAHLDLQNAEKNFAAYATTAKNLASAYKRFSIAKVRLFRFGFAPLTDIKEAEDFYRLKNPQSNDADKVAFTTLKSETAESGDMGYTYGSYEIKKGSQIIEKGYYLRFWRKEKGSWKLEFETTRPDPLS